MPIFMQQIYIYKSIKYATYQGYFRRQERLCKILFWLLKEFVIVFSVRFSNH